MESDFESIVAVSEPFLRGIWGQCVGVNRSRRSPGRGPAVQANVDEDTLSFNFNIAVALVEDNSNVVENEFMEAVGEIEDRNSFLCLVVRRYVSLKAVD